MIREVDEIMGNIAAAIEEQSVVTRDIAGNVSATARAIEE